MTRIATRRHVLELRKLGKSYSQIKAELGVSKSTLSVWLRKYPLSKEQIRLLRDVSEIRIEKFRQTMQLKREARLLSYYNEVKGTILPFSKRELLIAGLFLYWGEGGKTLRNQLSITNTDPAVLQFSLYWMIKALDISKDKIQVFTHFYDDMVVDDEINYWSKILKLPKNQFGKPYIKESKRINLDQKGFGHGTCGLRVSNTVIKEKILMTLKVISEYSGEYISEL